MLPGCAASGYHSKRTASSIHAAYVSLLLHLRTDTLGELQSGTAGSFPAAQLITRVVGWPVIATTSMPLGPQV